MKSLQKRNMIQPKSWKKSKQLKTNLKFKVVDSREVRDFMDVERKKLRGKAKKSKNTRTKRRMSKVDNEEEWAVVFIIVDQFVVVINLLYKFIGNLSVFTETCINT